MRAVSALVLRVVGVVSMSSVYFIQSQSGYPLQIIKGQITAAELASKVVQVFEVCT